MDLESETNLDQEIGQWLAFALQKLEELQTLKSAINRGRGAEQKALADNWEAINNRRQSTRVHKIGVEQALKNITSDHNTNHFIRRH